MPTSPPKLSVEAGKEPLSAEDAAYRRMDDQRLVEGFAKLVASSRKPRRMPRLPRIVDHASYAAHLTALTKALQSGKLTPAETRTYLALAQAAYESLP